MATKVFALTNTHVDSRSFFEQVRRFCFGQSVSSMEITDYPDKEANDHEVEDNIVQAVEHGDEVLINGGVLPHTLNRIRSRLNGHVESLVVL